jgi:hypothetical protein
MMNWEGCIRNPSWHNDGSSSQFSGGTEEDHDKPWDKR